MQTVSSGLRCYTQSCVVCQQNKIHRHTKSPAGRFAAPDGRFRHLHADLVGPLSEIRGCQYILTIIDRFTRWPVAVPLNSTIAESVARTIFQHWISIYGCPSIITTDRGPQFQSQLFTEFTNLLGARHISTTAYHPCSNGLVERFHRQLKAALTSIGATNQSSWIDNLPFVLLSLRTQVKEDLKCSPADLVFGQQLVLPGQYFSVTSTQEPSSSFITYFRKKMSSLAFTPTRYTSRDVYVPPSLLECEYVFVRQDSVRKPLTPHYAGPFRVLARTDKYYTLQTNHGRSTFSIDRLKPACIERDGSTNQPISPSLDSPQLSSPAPTRTASRRTVHWPKKFRTFITY